MDEKNVDIHISRISNHHKFRSYGINKINILMPAAKISFSHVQAATAVPFVSVYAKEKRSADIFHKQIDNKLTAEEENVL
ncbi:hypothetical protein CHS0354_004042 [Potamilus streckersoni]|uniref:Uncharacterized protein n=1 Tax=Potamilus streckersoni TaxID=2493646 RepID=A0AAE0SI44_9BIVA|nr:hypothetical protein CHS0354_004042 [Potamilus streckersoni]